MKTIKGLPNDEYQKQWRIKNGFQEGATRKIYRQEKKIEEMRTEREQLIEWADVRIDVEGWGYGDIL